MYEDCRHFLQFLQIQVLHLLSHEARHSGLILVGTRVILGKPAVLTNFDTNTPAQNHIA